MYFNIHNVCFLCKWNSRNPYALNQHLSYNALLRENILTDGTIQEFSRVTSSDFKSGTEEPFFFFFSGGLADCN